MWRPDRETISDMSDTNNNATPRDVSQPRPVTPEPTPAENGSPSATVHPFDEKAAAQANSAPASTKTGEQVIEPVFDGGDPDGGALGAEIGIEQLKAMIGALQGELDKKTSEAADKHDQFVRALAETENVRRRLEKEKDETGRYAISKFAKDILSVGDNFQRAISAVSADAVSTDPALKTLLDGVVLAEREYRSALERHGIQSIDPTGQPFNPHHHQAVMEHEDADVPPGTVMKVFMTGYMLDDRCLRPAMVVVSRGGSKAPKPTEAAPDAGVTAANGGPANGGSSNAADTSETATD